MYNYPLLYASVLYIFCNFAVIKTNNASAKALRKLSRYTLESAV